MVIIDTVMGLSAANGRDNSNGVLKSTKQFSNMMKHESLFPGVLSEARDFTTAFDDDSHSSSGNRQSITVS